MIDQSVFKDQDIQWCWASISASGEVRLHKGQPFIQERHPYGVYYGALGDSVTFSQEDVQPEGLEPQVLRRDYAIAPAAPAVHQLSELRSVALVVEPKAHYASVDVTGYAYASVNKPSFDELSGCWSCVDRVNVGYFELGDTPPQGTLIDLCEPQVAPNGLGCKTDDWWAGVQPQAATKEGCDPELEQAKERARHLVHHEELTLVQYMAIFGEAPN